MQASQRHHAQPTPTCDTYILRMYAAPLRPRSTLRSRRVALIPTLRDNRLTLSRAIMMIINPPCNALPDWLLPPTQPPPWGASPPCPLPPGMLPSLFAASELRASRFGAYISAVRPFLVSASPREYLLWGGFPDIYRPTVLPAFAGSHRPPDVPLPRAPAGRSVATALRVSKSPPGSRAAACDSTWMLPSEKCAGAQTIKNQ